MQKTRHTSQIICLIILGVMLSGCAKIEQERDDAVAQGAAAKVELGEVKAQLAEAQTQLAAAEALKPQLAEATTKLADTQAALTAAGNKNTAQQAQITKLTAQMYKAKKAQDEGALSLISTLAKLEEESKLNLQNNKLIQDLQAKVKELTDKLGSAGSVVPNL